MSKIRNVNHNPTANVTLYSFLLRTLYRNTSLLALSTPSLLRSLEWMRPKALNMRSTTWLSGADQQEQAAEG